MISINTAPILSLIFLLPFIALEVFNRRQFHEDFPYGLFFFAWIILSGLIAQASHFIKLYRANKLASQNSLSVIIQLFILLLCTYIFINWLIDQWPCLMGVSNCD